MLQTEVEPVRNAPFNVDLPVDATTWSYTSFRSTGEVSGNTFCT